MRNKNQITAALTNGQEGKINGTSIASPQVAGLLALMMEYNPDMPTDSLVNTMYATATDAGQAGEDEQFGHGIINPVAALEGINRFSTLAGLTCTIDGVKYDAFDYTKTVYDFDTTQDNAQHQVELTPPEGWSVSDVSTTNDITPGASRAYPGHGTHGVIVKLVNDDTRDIQNYTFNWNWIDPVDLSVVVPTISIPNQIYTGEPLTPATTVKIDDVTLKAGVDYTTEYANNINPGQAIVTITGTGNYTGVVRGSFMITKSGNALPANINQNSNQNTSNQNTSGARVTTNNDGYVSKTADEQLFAIMGITLGALAAAIALLTGRKQDI